MITKTFISRPPGIRSKLSSLTVSYDPDDSRPPINFVLKSGRHTTTLQPQTNSIYLLAQAINNSRLGLATTEETEQLFISAEVRGLTVEIPDERFRVEFPRKIADEIETFLRELLNSKAWRMTLRLDAELNNLASITLGDFVIAANPNGIVIENPHGAWVSFENEVLGSILALDSSVNPELLPTTLPVKLGNDVTIEHFYYWLSEDNWESVVFLKTNSWGDYFVFSEVEYLKFLELIRASYNPSK